MIRIDIMLHKHHRLESGENVEIVLSTKSERGFDECWVPKIRGKFALWANCGLWNTRVWSIFRFWKVATSLCKGVGIYLFFLLNVFERDY